MFFIKDYLKLGIHFVNFLRSAHLQQLRVVDTFANVKRERCALKWVAVNWANTKGSSVCSWTRACVFLWRYALPSPLERLRERGAQEVREHSGYPA
ncbi:unnamed protein product [Pieris brassicae]|uniref:Uncharacterized protein n=1 Tax=Pieris brassicae TaxID=7116 RepID=A0A9P0X8P4_PIEBR|nr:unnamed protein product [Pieris brassicae]